MKKILRSFIVSLLVLGSVSTVFAYASQDSCTLKKGSGGSQTAYVGYSRKANLSGKSDSSSKQIVELACWASWKGAIYPTTKEGRVNLSAGEVKKLYRNTKQRFNFQSISMSFKWIKFFW